MPVHPTQQPPVNIAVPQCFTFTYDAQLKDIKEIVSNIVTGSQEVVYTLNRVHEAVTMVTGEDMPLKVFRFSDIKHHLKAYLDDISKTLKMCYQFSSNWKNLSVARDKVNLIRLLSQLVDLCQRCHSLSSKLIGTHEFFVNIHATLSSMADKSSRRNVAPKVEEIIDSFTIATRDLNSASDDMATFFNGQLSLCKRYLEVAKSSDSMASVDEAKRFAPQWIENATTIQRAEAKIQLLIKKVDDPVSPNPATGESTRGQTILMEDITHRLLERGPNEPDSSNQDTLTSSPPTTQVDGRNITRAQASIDRNVPPRSSSRIYGGGNDSIISQKLPSNNPHIDKQPERRSPPKMQATSPNPPNQDVPQEPRKSCLCC
jgi:hypothetical protein